MTTWNVAQIGYESSSTWNGGTGLLSSSTPVGVRFTGLTAPVLIKSAQLLLTPTVISAEGSVGVQIERSRASGAFGDANLPSAMARMSLGSLAIEIADLDVAQALVLDVPILASLWNLEWSGAVNFILTTSDFSGTIGASPTLITDDLAVNEPSSVNWRGESTRWYLCPRCGIEVPISRVVQDGERRGLHVCKRCQDETGRRDTRGKGRAENEPRLWPRV